LAAQACSSTNATDDRTNTRVKSDSALLGIRKLHLEREAMEEPSAPPFVVLRGCAGLEIGSLRAANPLQGSATPEALDEPAISLTHRRVPREPVVGWWRLRAPRADHW
jgi:hypothetical protein